MTNHRIHHYTAIARALDPAFPTNRAVLLLVPLAAVIGAAVGWGRNADEIEILRQAGTFALIAFVSWALARELDPDDPAAAFISLACGVGVAWAAASPGLLIAITTLGLMRIVNRSSGLAARKTDSALLALLTIAVIYLTDSPLFGAVGALAFALDGTLREPLRHQWIAAFVCIGGAVVYMVDHNVAPGRFAAPDTLFEWLGAAFLLMYALNILLLRGVGSVGDVGHRALDLARVRGGMAVGLFAALQGIDEGSRVAVIVAAIAGICMGMAFRKGFRSQTAG